MRSFEIVTASPEETEQLAARLAPELRAGDVVTLTGDLGSGKTTFVRGACRALAVTRPVTSPTFTIAHRYEAGGERGHLDISHLDLYRFQEVEPEEWGTLEPYLDGAVCFVEWPDAGTAFLPVARVAISFRHVDPERRAITVESSDESLLQRVRGC